MGNFAGRWAGYIYGTNTGKVFVELEDHDGDLRGTAHLNDDSMGVIVFSLSGSGDDQMDLKLNPERVPENIEVSPGTLTGKLAEDGAVRGKWEMEAGTAGTFVLFRQKSADSQSLKSSEPEQIYNRMVKIGSTRLFRDDVARVVALTRKGFSEPKNLIVTYELHGNEVTKWADDFIHGLDDLTELRTLKLHIQEPGKGSVNRSVTIDLVETGDSAVRVSGDDESWVIGKAEALRKSLASYENAVITNYKKHGLNFNFILFVGMLILMPSIPTVWRRIVFAIVVMILVRILFAIHSKLIPNTLLLIRAKPRGSLALAWPTIFSWLSAASSSLVATLVYLWLTG